jgi:hypothetical protein
MSVGDNGTDKVTITEKLSSAYAAEPQNTALSA